MGGGVDSSSTQIGLELMWLLTWNRAILGPIIVNRSYKIERVKVPIVKRGSLVVDPPMPKSVSQRGK